MLSDIESERDPYEDAFALANGAACGNGGGGGDAVLSEPKCAFLADLVDTDLLSSATAARFTTDFHGPRSLDGFQEQLVRWALPEHDALRSVDDAFETLEENTALVERMATSGSTTSPAFLASLAARVKQIGDDLRDAETARRRDLAAYAHNTRLFGGDAVDAKAEPRPTGHAWQFQRDHQAFLQREERRRRPIHVERHATDATSRQVLLETFAPRLATARDVSVSMASATVAVAQDEDKTSSSAGPARKTELVVALAVQRRLACGGDVEWLDTQVAAHRELSLSPYVQQYLGCYEVVPTIERRGGASSEDHTEHLHCFELAPTTTLEQLLLASGELFKPDSLIVHYFAREIALAMLDLLDQSTHAWLTRLTPANVLLSASRRRVLLGRIEFGPPIDVLAPNAAPLDHHLARREAALLGDLAVLLFAMLFRATLPANVAAFRTAYLPRGSASRAFTSEFLVTDANEPLALRVCRGDRFALVFPPAQGGAACWRLQSACPPQLRVEEQRASPLPRFTFTARHAGDLRIAFVSAQGSRVVQLTVSAASYVSDPPTRWTTLVESCACAAVPLRQLLDRHALFRPLESPGELDALDTALERCSVGA